MDQYIAEKRVSGALLKRLQGYSAENCAAIRSLMELGPSANTLQELLQLLEEICMRDETTFSAVLNRPEITRVFEREGSSRKQGQKQLRRALEDIRFPKLAEMYAKLEEYQRAVKTDCGLRVTLPEDLEGDSVSITITARDIGELRESGERFMKIAAHPSMEGIFRILAGQGEE